MEIVHKTHNLKIAPRKLRLVAEAVKHLNANVASGALTVLNKKGAPLIAKSLKSAIQVAADNNLNLDSLSIQRMWCDEGMKLRRYIGNSHGRMTRINKHYSHLTIVLHGEPKVHVKKEKKVVKQTEEVQEEGNKE